jgi:16S rRNA (guanine527-N7)-methyltransferase
MIPANVATQFVALNVSRESLERLETYVAALTGWQARINLVGPSTLKEIWSRHILDCAQLLPLIPAGTTAIADLGSGAGLPGLVLGIIRPYRMHLYESNGKKASFLREAARLTKADAVVHNVRLETIGSPTPAPAAQLITARALAPLPELLNHAQPFLSKGATGLFHKGQDVDTELTVASKSWRIDSRKHPSLTDSRAVILEVKEAIRVER